MRVMNSERFTKVNVDPYYKEADGIVGYNVCHVIDALEKAGLYHDLDHHISEKLGRPGEAEWLAICEKNTNDQVQAVIGFCHTHGLTYYADIRGKCFEYKGAEKARREGLRGFVIEDLS